MCTRKTLLASAAICALTCAGTGLGAGAFTEGPFSDFVADTTDWGPENLVVPQFNDMGGTRELKCVTIKWVANIGGAIRLESNDNEAGMVSGRIEADISIMGPEVNAIAMPFAERSFDAEAFDGNNDWMGASGMSFENIVGDAAMDTIVLTDPGDFGPFIGNGDVIYVANAMGSTVANGPGNVTTQFELNARVDVSIEYEYDTEDTGICIPPSDVEPNDVCIANDIEASCSPHDFLECGKYVDGKLEKRIEPGCEPDTFLVLFDKQNNIINEDDNGSDKGNGWASGLFGVDTTDGIVDNGDGTFTLRIGVTGRADGLDNTFNGLFQNGPHGQLGKFKLYVTFLDGAGDPLMNPILPNGQGIENPVSYTDEFQTGAEAFHINYTLPSGTEAVDICIDNQIASEELRNDVDFFCIDNLVPLCDYCFTQIGGLDCECIPTATAVGWFDKSCELIFKEQGNMGIPGYTQLCFVADTNGRAIIAVSGASDCDFNGLDDALQDEGEEGDLRAPPECPEPTPGHGIAGCYTFCIEVVGDHGGTDPGTGGTGGDAAMEDALNHGDLNMDGKTDTADLGILIGNFGWIASQ